MWVVELVAESKAAALLLTSGSGQKKSRKKGEPKPQSPATRQQPRYEIRKRVAHSSLHSFRPCNVFGQHACLHIAAIPTCHIMLFETC